MRRIVLNFTRVNVDGKNFTRRFQITLVNLDGALEKSQVLVCLIRNSYNSVFQRIRRNLAARFLLVTLASWGLFGAPQVKAAGWA